VRLLLRTVTVLLVLGLVVLGVAFYRMETERAPMVASDAPRAIALGKFTALAAPRPAPAASFSERDGKAVTLASFRGRVVLVNLWATWCAPCIKEMPSLARLQAKMKGLAILAVSQDRRGAAVVDPFIAKIALNGLAIYLDPQNALTHAFGVVGLPTSVLVDRDGRILGELQGAAEWDSDAMVKLLSGYVERREAGKS
jgi:thiol-disulfide isomerase/thioredoxin